MNTDFVTLDKFKGFESSISKFRKTLKNFSDSDNSFFDAIIYGIMFYKSEGKILEKGKIAEVLGVDFYNELLEIKDEAKLDRTVFGYLNTCFKVNEVLSNHNFFSYIFRTTGCIQVSYTEKSSGKKQADEKPFQLCC